MKMIIMMMKMTMMIIMMMMTKIEGDDDSDCDDMKVMRHKDDAMRIISIDTYVYAAHYLHIVE